MPALSNKQVHTTHTKRPDKLLLEVTNRHYKLQYCVLFPTPGLSCFFFLMPRRPTSSASWHLRSSGLGALSDGRAPLQWRRVVVVVLLLLLVLVLVSVSGPGLGPRARARACAHPTSALAVGVALQCAWLRTASTGRLS
jgi:hypothetical protein